MGINDSFLTTTETNWHLSTHKSNPHQFLNPAKLQRHSLLSLLSCFLSFPFSFASYSLFQLSLVDQVRM
ncbi:hypothetical protein VNO77_19538 [Canavalia gladiata]|uniref:Uncharacterized protein n=1 Tax=Canavalia gladiata TaxID=3824 RepID=A0AAN9LR43_CANGL